MQALGFVETRGLVAAIESADAMLKAAEVHLIERTFVKGGIVTITITGDVAACRASVDAAIASVTRMGGTILSTHVIPRPHESLDGLVIGSADLIQEKEEIEKTEDELQEETLQAEPEADEDDSPNPETEAVEGENQETDAKKAVANRAAMEELKETDGIDRAVSSLKRSRTAEIKEMILNEYPEINLSSESVMNMTKKELTDCLKDFYTN